MAARKKTTPSVDESAPATGGVKETAGPVAGGEPAAAPQQTPITNGQVAESVLGLIQNAGPDVRALILNGLANAPQQPVGGRRPKRKRAKPNPARIVAAYGSVIHTDDFEVAPPEWVTEKDKGNGYEINISEGKWGPETEKWLDRYYSRGKTLSAAGAAHEKMQQAQEKQLGPRTSLSDITGITSPEEAAQAAQEEFAVPTGLEGVKV